METQTSRQQAACRHGMDTASFDAFEHAFTINLKALRNSSNLLKAQAACD
jgi:hypothetical protein